VKAVRFHRHGGPEVLRYEEAPDPVPTADEVLVRVKACALFLLVMWGRSWTLDLKLSLSPTLGSELVVVV